MWKKLTALALCAALLLAVPACRNDDKPVVQQEGHQTVKLYFWKSGLGSSFIERIAADFNASQEDYTVELDITSSASTIMSSMNAGRNNEYDVYFTMLNTSQFHNDFLQLDDILDRKYAGETMSIREKYYDELLDSQRRTNGNIHTLTFGNGWCGLFYNANIIDGVRFSTPNTTNELSILVDDLGGAGYTPFVQFNDTLSKYWSYVFKAWTAQYDGTDYYYDTLLALTDESGNSPSQQVLMRQDGRYQSLKVLEEIITPNTVTTESNTQDFAAAQSQFLNDEAVMMANGNWIEGESGRNCDHIKLMKTPVISSIVEKLENTAMTDATLSAIVSQVDAGALTSDLCSQNDFDRIRAARNLLYNNSSELYTFISKYSDAIDGSKAFLTYFYSDAAQKVFMEETRLPACVQMENPALVDVSGWTDYQKAQLELTASGLQTLCKPQSMHEIYISGGASDEFLNADISLRLSAKNPADRRSAQDIWGIMMNTVTRDWNQWLSNIPW